MIINFPWLKQKEPEINLVLDIGSETIKSLVFQKNKEEFIVLGTSFEYFDKFEVFDASVFKKDIIKKAISKILQNFKEEAKKSPERVLLNPPATIFKARIVSQRFIRKNYKEIINKKEEEKILQKVLNEFKEKISQKFSGKFGIPAKDIYFVNLKILEIKIDGYEVPTLIGYKGQKLNFKVFGTFLSKYYLKDIENVIQAMDFKNTKIVHKAEGLIFYLEFFPKSDGIFINIEEGTTQIFLVKKGKLEKINEIKIGGGTFSQALSEKLGLTKERSRILKERYSEKMLSEGSSKRIKEIIWPDIQDWFLNLKKKSLNQKILISKNIFLFGKESQLPGIKEILKKDGFNPKYLKDIKTANLPKKILNNSQYISSFLICYTL